MEGDLSFDTVVRITFGLGYCQSLGRTDSNICEVGFY